MVRLFSHYFPSRTLFQIVLEASLLFAAVALGVLLFYPGARLALAAIFPSAIAIAVIMTALISFLGLYRADRHRSFAASAARIVIALGVGLPILHSVFYSLPNGELCREALEVTMFLALAGTLALRAAFIFGDAESVFRRRVLILGTGTDAANVDQTLRRSNIPGLEIVGFYPVDGGQPAVPASQILKSNVSVLDTAVRLGVQEIIVAVRERRGGVLPLNQLLSCKLEGVKVTDLSSFFERCWGEVRIDSLRASWLIYGEGFRQGPFRTFVKRSFDVVVSALMLLAAAPVMVVTAIAIALESSGPVIYRQERVGRGGRVFEVLKFRSMCTNAESDGKPRWADCNDPRITRVGRIIRAARIDELPQLINVLKGDMSLVGPRPERPYFVAQLTQQIPFYAARHSVKPGITGWAQVRYTYGASVDDAIHKLQYDLYYVKNHTLFLDLVILFKTVRVVLTCEGSR